MKVNFEGFEDFMAFVPALVLVGIHNEIMSDDASNYFDDISKKIKNVTRQYFVANPDLRLKLKRMISGFENNENVILTINATGEKIEKIQTQESKYLTENWLPMNEIIKKYMKENINNEEKTI